MGYKYDLLDEEGKRRDSNSVSNPARRTIPYQFIGNVLLSLAVLVLSLRLYVVQSRPNCIERWSTPSPIIPLVEDVPRAVKFNGTFDHPSPYKGPPNDDVDKAWDDLYGYGLVRIAPEDLKRINGSEGSARWPDEAGGGYVGFLEVLHQIHCVHFLWQHLYEDYYENHASGKGFVDPKPIRLQHANHCADLLRQKIMCDADLGMIPMFWVNHHDHPWPDFSTTHQCRNFDAAVQWVVDNQVDFPELNLTRLPGTINLELPP